MWLWMWTVFMWVTTMHLHERLHVDQLDMTLPRHDDQLIQVVALPTQLADEVIHAVDDRHILVHLR